MKDARKTKGQLVNELVEMRQRIAELEALETERKRAEEALRREKDNVISILDAMEDGVYIVNQRYDIEYVNPALKKEFGPFEGRKCYEYFHDRKEVCPWCKNQDVFAGKTVRWEWYSFKNQKTYDLIDTPLRNPDGSISKLEILRDITERKQAEETLRESEERYHAIFEQAADSIVLVDAETGALVEFNDRAYENLGHTREEFQKLKIPDFKVIESAEEVAKHIEKIILKMVLSDTDETTREYLDIISSEVRNSTKIVSDLLDFARTRPAEREEIVVSELVAQTLEKQPPPEEVQVTTEIAPDLPPVFVDPRQIGQVLGNLVINAYQAMPEGGDLTISAWAEEDKVALSITDTGCGISPENIGKLLEPLFTTKARGIGLGLAVSKNLVEANGGGIEVESQEGQGSTFTVILPVKEAMS